ncbi:hypothetical protein ACX80E_14770 [Arthrobacter sp. TMN-49]
MVKPLLCLIEHIAVGATAQSNNGTEPDIGFCTSDVIERQRLTPSVSDLIKNIPTCTRLRGIQPKLSKKQEAQLVSVHRAGTNATPELAELFSVARSTVYRAIKRAGGTAS